LSQSYEDEIKRKVEYHLRKGGWFRENEEMRVLSKVVYMTKSRGPRTEPRGTPQEEMYLEERLFSHLTRK